MERVQGLLRRRRQRWDYEGYTQLYNQVYNALKKVNKNDLVGGPYLVMDSYAPRGPVVRVRPVKGPWGSVDQRVLDAFTYWNKHKAGADFVVVDGASFTRDDQLLPDAFSATDKLTAVSDVGAQAERRAAAVVGRVLRRARAGPAGASSGGSPPRPSA